MRIENLKRISKSQARYYFNKGIKIYLNPSKMRIGSVWNMCFDITKNDNNTDFEVVSNAFHYYNCSKETGRVIHYYIDKI